MKLNEKKDVYETEFSNLGLKGVEIVSHYVKEFEKLLAGGIWCILKMNYYYDEETRDGKDHLQEWIANEPSVLGEELLIIQKELEYHLDRIIL